VANLVYSLKLVVATHPTLAVIGSRLRHRAHVLGSGTDIVIEGFPRSANSFVVQAFERTQARPLTVAHHTHAPGHVIAACRRGVPALVLMRQPSDAVSRCALIRPRISLRLLLRGWLGFYRPLLPWRDRFHVGTFQEVTSDLGAVMIAMNRHLGTDFIPFEHSQENVDRLFRGMEEDWAEKIDPRSPAFEAHIGRPSALADEMAAEIATALRAPGLTRIREQANQLYRELATNQP
jgi:hypothetical protein